jgi:pimeloyl-ACP methyl ester carboxylesterase
MLQRFAALTLLLTASLAAVGASAPQAAAPDSSSASNSRRALQLGSLQLHRCQIGGRTGDGIATIEAFCGALAVPEDWDRPRGRHINLKVAYLGADSASPAGDVVTFLDGGPGGAATEDFAAIAPALEPLRARRSIVLMDQRGTGGSNALNCPPPKDASPTASDVASITQWVHQCLAELAPHAAPQLYTTSAAVRDLEAVRKAIGAPALDLIAISYGTRVAQQYAMTYPASVRAVVLDSAVPNSLALLSDHARNLERTLRSLFAHCRAEAACARRFGDPYTTLYRVRARLQQQPQSVQLRDPVSFELQQRTLTADDLAALVRFYAYSPLTAALLPLMLQQADQGDYATLLGQKQLLAQDLGDQITGAVELSVLCAEDADLLRSRPEDEDTLLGNSAIVRARAACEQWPAGARPAYFHRRWHSALPTLLLSGELDPVTPPEYAHDIMRGLSSARLLLAPGQGHAVLAVGCMPRLVERFITTLQPLALDADCLQHLAAPPAFLNYNGAGP